ncbi:hypothetical protein PRUPE_1G496100 [Prunus persica]|uniref:Uncharacterized protein n=1 Tax=Prunus persica TaxID=3760 RepID=A0A251RG00_PRUPE|nr:hypothetical protein PRUPE_1G496100 [Prunus persica]ONI34741.1 hypothetical protein PRUPE_1G496100 [Prunus persica]
MTTQISHINFDNSNLKSESVIQKPLLDSFMEILRLSWLTDVVQEGHVWKWELVHKEGCVKRTVPLFILKDVVDDSRHEYEEHLFCIYCSYPRCNNNLVSKCKYHFVISADYESGEQLDDPFDKDVYFFKDWTHLIHWLLNNNGIGRLICVNWINEGSAFITGRDIMHLWGLLCLYFQVR